MSVLPEVSDIPALSVDYFPTPWQAALFRCWGRQRSFKEISAIAGFVSDLSAAILAAPFLSVRSCSPAAYSSIRMETRVWYPPSLLRKPFGFRPNSTKPARRYMLSARSFSATAVSSSWV